MEGQTSNLSGHAMHKTIYNSKFILVRIPDFRPVSSDTGRGRSYSIFIIFYDTKRGEISCQDRHFVRGTAVVLLKFIDDREQASRWKS